MKTVTTTAAAKTPTTNQLVNSALRGLQRDIETLSAWLITNPRDYVVVAKDRMHVVQRDGDNAKVGIYPQLPTIFYAGDVAYRIAAGFKCHKGDASQIQWEVMQVRAFANAAIPDLQQRLTDLKMLQDTL